MTNGYLEKTVIDWIPGMPPIRLGDFSSFLRTTDPNDFGLRFNESEANKCAKAGALILNTFDGLEADVLAALRAKVLRKKKSEVSEKRVYRISRKIIGFAILISDEI